MAGLRYVCIMSGRSGRSTQSPSSGSRSESGSGKVNLLSQVYLNDVNIEHPSSFPVHFDAL